MEKKPTPKKPQNKTQLPPSQWGFFSKKKKPVNESEAIQFKVTFQMSNIEELRN